VRAVLDSSVLVSALISPAGPSAQILAAWTQERFELVMSPQVLDELTEVLDHPKFRRWVSTHVATDFIAGREDAALLFFREPDELRTAQKCDATPPRHCRDTAVVPRLRS
jgi:putative PIN family toxin of toxin-antitoxin system